MLERIKAFFSRLHHILTLIFVRFLLQKVLSTLLMVLTYFFVLGPTALFYQVSRLFKPHSEQNSWIEATGYEPDQSKARRQS